MIGKAVKTEANTKGIARKRKDSIYSVGVESVCC